MDFTIKTTLPTRLPKEKMQRWIADRTNQLWKRCIREFLEAVVLSIGDSVASGMSISSLLPLGKAVDFRVAMIESLRGKGPHGKRYFSKRFPGVQPFKTRSHGEQLGKKAYTIKFATPTTSKYRFEFKIRVLQFYLQEYGITGQDHWQSLEAGRDAFIACFKANWKKYLPPSAFADYFKRGKAPLEANNG